MTTLLDDSALSHLHFDKTLNELMLMGWLWSGAEVVARNALRDAGGNQHCPLRQAARSDSPTAARTWLIAAEYHRSGLCVLPCGRPSSFLANPMSPLPWEQPPMNKSLTRCAIAVWHSECEQPVDVSSGLCLLDSKVLCAALPAALIHLSRVMQYGHCCLAFAAIQLFQLRQAQQGAWHALQRQQFLHQPFIDSSQCFHPASCSRSTD